MDRLKTPLCDLLGIEYPILQSGMGGVAGPELVAEVCRAGGLGILAGLNSAGRRGRTRIRQVRDLTDRPFGVNLWLHTEVHPPADTAVIPEATVQAVQRRLNVFRERLGIPPSTRGRAGSPISSARRSRSSSRSACPVWSIGLGKPSPEMVGALPRARRQDGGHGGHGG